MKLALLKTFAAAGVALTMTGAALAATTIKVAVPTPAKGWFAEMHQWWGQEVEKRSNGELKVQFFFGGSLVKWPDSLPAIQSGIADMAWISSSYTPANLGHFIILDNMLNFGDDYVAAVKAAIDSAEQQPDLVRELKREDIIPLMSHISGHGPVGTKKNLTSIDELKGKSLRTYGGARTVFYKELAMNPIFMTFPEMYNAMDRGTVDALGENVLLLANAFKLNEVIRNQHQMNPPGANGNGGVISNFFAMRGEKWRSLTADQQKMLKDLRLEYGIRYASKLMEDEVKVREQWAKNNNITFQTSSPGDAQKVLKAAQVANESFYKEQEGTGAKNVRAVYAFYEKTRKTYEEQHKKTGSFK
jgi:TRAP-type C4-dicarboxylate transport system substrate-binding protein